MTEQIEQLTTEKPNLNTLHLDELSPLEIVQIMNDEDQKVALAVNKELPKIANAIELIVKQLQIKGRVIYFGAGTSGRLGILDASECPPTFSTTDEFMALIAGGERAMKSAVEGAEDSETLIIEELKAIKFTSKDVAVGIAASGKTPYVISGLKYAKQLGAHTISISCNPDSMLSKVSDVGIDVEVGPEVLTGSTRLKAGTATKMVLNMLSTASMVQMGKVYGNLMVDLNPSNIKLIDRAKRIIMQATGVNENTAHTALQDANLKAKVAIVMIKKKCSANDAIHKLEKANGFVSKALKIK
jgi:N-acetylmuramic acid 6-phosphate etherase